MKTIIISDLHNRVDWVEPFLSSMSYDKVVFLGDYFDDFNDILEDAKKSALWLKQSLKVPNRIHLMGTHDMWYRLPKNQFLMASGNTSKKSNVINKILFENDWNLLKLYHCEQGFLLTHAGLHQFHLCNENKLLYIDSLINKALNDIKEGKISTIFDAGFARGGRQPFGGITWLDWDQEFEPIPFLNQIVGHTEHKVPQEKSTKDSKNYCIDTKNRHIGILENGQFSVIPKDTYTIETI